MMWMGGFGIARRSEARNKGPGAKLNGASLLAMAISCVLSSRRPGLRGPGVCEWWRGLMRRVESGGGRWPDGESSVESPARPTICRRFAPLTVNEGGMIVSTSTWTEETGQINTTLSISMIMIRYLGDTTVMKQG